MSRNIETAADVREWLAEVERALAGIDYVSLGACPGCADCGLADVHDMENEAYELASEPGFSWYACESCNGTLGGDRYPAHGFLDGKLLHLRVCGDCYCLLGNGVPDAYQELLDMGRE